jgi:hypothetical protein
LQRLYQTGYFLSRRLRVSGQSRGSLVALIMA